MAILTADNQQKTLLYLGYSQFEVPSAVSSRLQEDLSQVYHDRVVTLLGELDALEVDRQENRSQMMIEETCNSKLNWAGYQAGTLRERDRLIKEIASLLGIPTISNPTQRIRSYLQYQ